MVLGSGLACVISLVIGWFIRGTDLLPVKDELEKNNEHVTNILNSVQTLSDGLYKAGMALSQVSENESASAEELAATSEQLVESSNQLSAKTDESMSSLSELSEWKKVVADNVEKVETASKDLLDKSMENEKLLNDLHAINGEVSQSKYRGKYP